MGIRRASEAAAAAAARHAAEVAAAERAAKQQVPAPEASSTSAEPERVQATEAPESRPSLTSFSSFAAQAAAAAQRRSSAAAAEAAAERAAETAARERREAEAEIGKAEKTTDDGSVTGRATSVMESSIDPLPSAAAARGSRTNAAGASRVEPRQAQAPGSAAGRGGETGGGATTVVRRGVPKRKLLDRMSNFFGKRDDDGEHKMSSLLRKEITAAQLREQEFRGGAGALGAGAAEPSTSPRTGEEEHAARQSPAAGNSPRKAKNRRSIFGRNKPAAGKPVPVNPYAAKAAAQSAAATEPEVVVAETMAAAPPAASPVGGEAGPAPLRSPGSLGSPRKNKNRRSIFGRKGAAESKPTAGMASAEPSAPGPVAEEEPPTSPRVRGRIGSIFGKRTKPPTPRGHRGLSTLLREDVSAGLAREAELDAMRAARSGSGDASAPRSPEASVSAGAAAPLPATEAPVLRPLEDAVSPRKAKNRRSIFGRKEPVASKPAPVNPYAAKLAAAEGAGAAAMPAEERAEKETSMGRKALGAMKRMMSISRGRGDSRRPAAGSPASPLSMESVAIAKKAASSLSSSKMQTVAEYEAGSPDDGEYEKLDPRAIEAVRPQKPPRSTLLLTPHPLCTGEVDGQGDSNDDRADSEVRQGGTARPGRGQLWKALRGDGADL